MQNCLSFAGMLEDGVEEFGTSEDLFEAIGPLLQQVDDTKTDDDIREICDRLYNLVTKGYAVYKLLNGSRRKKTCLRGSRTTKMQTSLRICAV